MENLLREIPNLDEQDLILLNGYIIGQLKRVRAVKSRAMKTSLNEGDKVTWSGRKGTKTGTVVSIKRKFAHVDAGNGTWRVPMNILQKD